MYMGSSEMVLISGWQWRHRHSEQICGHGEGGEGQTNGQQLGNNIHYHM